jgi:hypothetical protein
MRKDTRVPPNGAVATREGAALVLLQIIAGVEGKVFANGGNADRKWVLDTYAECLRTIRGEASTMSNDRPPTREATPEQIAEALRVVDATSYGSSKEPNLRLRPRDDR